VTVRDQERLDKIRALTDPDHPTTVTHWLTPRPGDRTTPSSSGGPDDDTARGST
jgi:hypothetical protein